MRGFSVLFWYDRPNREKSSCPGSIVCLSRLLASQERSRSCSLRDAAFLRPVNRSKYPSRHIIAEGNSGEDFVLTRLSVSRNSSAERPPQEACCGPGPGHVDSQGSCLGKLLSPPKRRQAGEPQVCREDLAKRRPQGSQKTDQVGMPLAN